MDEVEVTTVQTSNGQTTVEEYAVYIFELNNELARRIGIDLAGIGVAVRDADTIRRVINELGVTGRGYIKRSGGRIYFILKGRAGLRTTLTGTRYLANNPQVAHMAFTAREAARSVARMTKIMVVVYGAFRIAEQLLSGDDVDLAAFLGTVTTDLAKFAIASTVAAAATVAAGAVTTIVAGPLIIGFIVGLGVTIALDRADRALGITEGLVRILNDILTSLNGPSPREMIATYQALHPSGTEQMSNSSGGTERRVERTPNGLFIVDETQRLGTGQWITTVALYQANGAPVGPALRISAYDSPNIPGGNINGRQYPRFQFEEELGRRRMAMLAYQPTGR